MDALVLSQLGEQPKSLPALLAVIGFLSNVHALVGNEL